MKKQTLALWALAIGLLTSCSSSKRPDLGDGLFAEINTSMGTVIFALEQEKTPVTVASFVSLAEGDNPYVSETYKNKKFYDGLTFHRVALLGANFIIQGGDPEGTGMGGPGYQFKDEIDATLSHNDKGILSMANAGAGTNGSQFFITHVATPWLDGNYNIFGNVIMGQEVVTAIGNTPRGQADKPKTPVYMTKVQIIRIGDKAKKFDANDTFKSMQ
jgi:peptidyl-prolyl cis-trans isomerase A (cyclophilin A)